MNKETQATKRQGRPAASSVELLEVVPLAIIREKKDFSIVSPLTKTRLEASVETSYHPPSNHWASVPTAITITRPATITFPAPTFGAVATITLPTFIIHRRDHRAAEQTADSQVAQSGKDSA